MYENDVERQVHRQRNILLIRSCDEKSGEKNWNFDDWGRRFNTLSGKIYRLEIFQINGTLTSRIIYKCLFIFFHSDTVMALKLSRVH